MPATSDITAAHHQHTDEVAAEHCRLASSWRISYQGRSRIVSVMDLLAMCRPNPDGDLCWIRAFDLRRLEFIEKDQFDTSERTYRRMKRQVQDESRYLRMPDLDLASPADRLRQFIEEEVQGEEGRALYLAACSGRPFRAFKEAASQEVLNKWSATEEQERQSMLYDYFIKAGVQVEAADADPVPSVPGSPNPEPR